MARTVRLDGPRERTTSSGPMGLVNELKRRKLIRAGAVYAASAFAVLEGADVLLSGLGLPPAAMRVVSLLAIAGFPVALCLSWFLEWTPAGVRVTASARTPEGQAELAAASEHSLLDLRTALIVGVLVIFGLGLGTGWLLTERTGEPGSDGPSIAVLPFENRGSGTDTDFFVDGIHDEILTQLSKIGALRVISRSSVMRYREQPKPLRVVGQELGVGTVLEGGVQRAGSQVRVSVELADTKSEDQLWAESYEVALTPENLFSIQRDVSRQIATALHAELSPTEEADLAQIPTTSLEAYDLYLRGNAFYTRQAVVEDFAAAADMYERALELDPDFALAWANLSRAYSAMYHFHADRTPERRAAAEQAVERALAIDPDLPEAHRALGWYRYWGFRDYQGALAALEVAAGARPGDLDVAAAKAAIQRRMGDVEGSAEAQKQVIRVNPLDPNPMGNLSSLYAEARRYDEALEWGNRTLNIDPDDEQERIQKGSIPLWRDGNATALRLALQEMEGWEDQIGFLALERWRVEYLTGRQEAAIRAAAESDFDVLAYQTYYYPRALLSGLARSASGDEAGARADFDEARRVVEQALAVDPDEPRMLAARGLALAGLGERDLAIASGRRAVEVYPSSLDALDGPEYVLELARIFGMLGDLDGAIDQLTVYLRGLGVWSLPGLLVDPVFRGLADHPRYPELLTVEGHR